MFLVLASSPSLLQLEHVLKNNKRLYINILATQTATDLRCLIWFASTNAFSFSKKGNHDFTFWILPAGFLISILQNSCVLLWPPLIPSCQKRCPSWAKAVSHGRVRQTSWSSVRTAMNLSIGGSVLPQMTSGVVFFGMHTSQLAGQELRLQIQIDSDRLNALCIIFQLPPHACKICKMFFTRKGFGRQAPIDPYRRRISICKAILKKTMTTLARWELKGNYQKATYIGWVTAPAVEQISPKIMSGAVAPCTFATSNGHGFSPGKWG